MKKKPTKNKPTPNRTNSSQQVPVQTIPSTQTLQQLKVKLGLLIAILAFLLYANSIGHGFTLDDHPAIDENKVTTMGLAGIPTLAKTDYWYGYLDEYRGPIYRPTSLIVFSIVWQFFPNNPHVYHLVNVLTYAATCCLLFLLLCQVFKKQNLLLPFVCALLYTAHPIHTEVVNNIKSMDEMLCMLFGISSLLLIQKYLSHPSVRSLVLGGVCFFLSLISKETGITFLAAIPLVIYFFGDASLKKQFYVLGMLAAITGLYFVWRSMVLSDLPTGGTLTANVLNNSLYAAPDLLSRYATIFYILLRYVGLLIFPHPLSCDYNFAQLKIQTLSDPGAWLGMLLFVGLGIFALLNFKKKNLLAFAFLFFVVTLAPVSNVFFLNGATMAERFLYIPSLGFCVALAYLMIHYFKVEIFKSHFSNLSQFFSRFAGLFVLVFGIVFLYSFKSISRNQYWENNLTIFGHDVQNSPNSATANKIYGSSLYEAVKGSSNLQNQLDTFQIAKRYLKKALEIYPIYKDPLSVLGVIYYIEGKFDSAYFFQKKALDLNENEVSFNVNLGKTLNKLTRYAEAIAVSKHALTLDPKDEGAHFNLALAYTNQGDNDNGLLHFSKIIALNPERADAYHYAGLLLQAKGDQLKANEYLAKAKALGYK